MNRVSIRTLLMTSALVAVPVALAAQVEPSTAPRMIDLGSLAPGDPSDWSEAYGVTPDGRVVIGRARTADGSSRAFRWTAEGGMVDLGSLRSDDTGSSYVAWWGSWGYSGNRGVTDDGAIIVGEASTDDGTQRAFRWTAAGGMVDLGSLRSDRLGHSYAYTMSADGSVVGGYAYRDGSSNHTAVLWRFDDPMAPTGFDTLDLGTLRAGDDGWSYVHGMTADGAVAIGRSATDDGRERGFRWTEATGMVELRSLRSDGLGYAYVYAASADGNVLGGQSEHSPSSDQRAILWRFDSRTSPDYETLDLGTLRADNSGWAYVQGLTEDGSVAVGHAATDDHTNRSFRWTEATGMVDLRSARSDGTGYTYSYAMSGDGNVLAGYGQGDFSDYQALVWRFASTTASDHDLLTLGSLRTDGTGYSYAQMISRDGRVVVGHARTDDDDNRSFAWTEAGGMVDLGSLRSDGLGYSYPYHMTPDGSVVVGYAETDSGRYHAFLWRGTMLDMVNTQIQLQATAAAVGAAAAQATLAAQMRLGAELDVARGGVTASSQGLAAAVEAGPARAPVALSIGGGLTRNGDVGTRGSVDVIAATGLPGGYTLGGFVELGREASSDGVVELDGTQVAGGVSLRYRADPGFTGLTWRVAALAETGRADITREALLPGTLAGTGNARITTAAASVEVGQGFAMASGVVIPYARLSHGRTTRSAYDEAGATGFPLSFEKHEDEATTLTLAVDSRMAVGAQGTLRLGAGVSHDLSRSTDPIRGTSAIPGFTSFEVAGPALENRTRLHLEASYTHALASGAAVTGSAGIAQQPWSSTPSIGVRIGYDMRF